MVTKMLKLLGSELSYVLVGVLFGKILLGNKIVTHVFNCEVNLEKKNKI